MFRVKNSHSSSKIPYYYELIPIDHGLCLPDCFEICNYEIVWMDWPQVKEPLSKKTLEFIDSLNPKNDVELLCSKLTLRKKCLRNFYLVEILVKTAARKGFTLFEIGNMIYKNDEDDEKETDIKNLIEKTKYIYKIIKSNNNKSLDKWVRKSISLLNEKNQKKDPTKNTKNFQKAFDEPIIEEENEEEFKQNPEELKRRKSFSDNFSLAEDESPSKIKDRLKVHNALQSPRSNSNSTEDDFHLNESIQLKKKLSIKFQKNEVKIIQKSPDHLALKRCLSMPYLKRNDSKVSKSSDEFDREEDFILEKGRSKKGRYRKKIEKNLKAEEIYDDVFIYYFESFLNQMLDLKMKEKKRAKNIYRNRVYSSEVGLLKN